MSTQRDLGHTTSSVVIYGTLGAVTACAATCAAGWYISGLASRGVEIEPFFRTLLWSAMPNGLSAFFQRSLLAEQCTAWLSQYASWVPMATGISAAVGGLLGGWSGWKLSAPRTDVIRGRRYLTGSQGLKVVHGEMAQEARWSGSGIHIHPDIQISRDRETRGIMVVGAIGGGKTVVIKHIIADVVRRGDKVLIYDNKGDFTSEINSLVDDKSEVGLIAPWDKRSMRWSVAKDVRSATAARELATRLIPQPESGDAQWAQGAALILSGLITTLASESNGWSWNDLLQAITLDYHDLRAFALRKIKLATNLLPEEQSQTTQSYLSVLISGAGGTISDLAAADAEASGRNARVWNTHDWMLGKGGPQIVVMQDSSQFSTIAQAMGSSVFRSARGAIGQMPESKTNRVWLIIDEFPQLGRIQGVDGIIDTGRSKGVCVVLGFQTKAKIDDIYGESFADALLGNFGTQIICRSGSAETRHWAAEQIGQQEVRRVIESRSANTTVFNTKNQTTGFNQSEQIVTQAVVLDTDLAGLGRRGDGIDAVLVTGSHNYVAKVWWPFAKGWQKLGKPNVPAAWTIALGVPENLAEQQATVPRPQSGSVVEFNHLTGHDVTSVSLAIQQAVPAAQEEPESPESPGDELLIHHASSKILNGIAAETKVMVDASKIFGELASTANEAAPTMPVRPVTEELARRKIRVRKKPGEPKPGA
ncbi:MAG: type IV secretion system DNA-binding domain-containing protein [Halothiobacillus sp.]|jgi:hypothetical protein|nr:type IV secretion system DNA-binding domain-containing protein [Halothiobacillus sp.]